MPAEMLGKAKGGEEEPTAQAVLDSPGLVLVTPIREDSCEELYEDGYEEVEASPPAKVLAARVPSSAQQHDSHLVPALDQGPDGQRLQMASMPEDGQRQLHAKQISPTNEDATRSSHVQNPTNQSMSISDFVDSYRPNQPQGANVILGGRLVTDPTR